MGNWWLAASSQQHTCSAHLMLSFVAKHQITQVIQSPTHSPDLVPCDFWFFPNLKSPLKGKRFRTVCEIEENMVGQLMAIGRTMWGPKVPTLKGTEASLSYVWCFLYIVSPSINVFTFYITCLDTFWTDLMYIFYYIYIYILLYIYLSYIFI